ncbi:hypothetical protein M427DRAFT_397802 [Gonapodya prolifera JEL478]|uniref:Uncharacterized protein n=1 Tax=Gonapodya prolifera (strain JEL478) TaxID=1344416 RepID=A0A139A6M3_GONPJ|nr:hypothetical protein M427DRAFT_397802 [Gonapodya prolifera JEL478]|eukprot:KXS12467.1 hypothetical protein M427DRAFT_397802 [Gonapodya prolifera JEL478]
MYRELDDTRALISVHEVAYNTAPRDEDRAKGYFGSVVANRDLKLQQQRFTQNRYFMWIVMSLLLQARENHDDKTNIFYPLAKRMIAKAAADGKLETYDELFVYVSILLDQGKTAEAYMIVSGPLGNKCIKREIEHQLGCSSFWRN